MILIAYFVLIFFSIQLLVSVANALVKSTLRNTQANFNELVSVMIPARNEENNITNILSDLQHQTYGNIEIIVFDDQSTDRTAKLVAEMAQYDKRIRLTQSSGLPEGWLGKNFACHSLAEMAKGKYYLFLDADVRLDEYVIVKYISYLHKNNLGLLSVFPKQFMYSIGEKMVVPLMNYILLTLLPLFLVHRSQFASLSAANGQFMLFDAETYKKILPHKKMKSERVEDIKIARHYKKEGQTTACLTGSHEISCRMYSSFNDAVNGFSKNVVMFFGNSYVLAFLFWLLSTFGFIAVWLALPGVWFLALCLIAVIIRILVSISSRQHILLNLCLAIPQQLTLGWIILKSFLLKQSNGYEWKGRKV